MPQDDQTGKKGAGRAQSGGKEKLPAGKSWFFGIGINEYEHFPDLNNAVGDVKAIHEVLRKKYQLDESITLFNQEATRRNIFKQLKSILKSVGPDDKLFILFSGHGFFSQTSEGFWVPHEAEPDFEDDYLPNFHLKHYLKHIKARHILVVSDSCFSGSLFAEGATKRAFGADERLEQKKSRYGICSGRDNEEVWDGPQGGHSPFAGSILEILEENQASLFRASIFADEVLNRTTVQYRQLPRHGPLFSVGDKGGQYVFRLKNDEQNAFESAKKRDAIPAYSAFLRAFPNGIYADQALSRIVELEDDQAWQDARKRDQVSGYFRYLRRHPEGRHVEEANEAIERLEQRKVEPTPEIKLTKKKKEEKEKEEVESPIVHKRDEKFGSFTDPRDDQTYQTVKLNGLVWMAENLNFDVGEGCWIYEKIKGLLGLLGGKEKVLGYGRLYTWEAAKNACPPGWRLPTDEEWNQLINSFGGSKEAYEALIEGGKTGFSARLGGWRNSGGSFLYLGDDGFYWSATERASDFAWYYYFGRDNGKLNRSNDLKSDGRSCRCVQDA